jgi:hypothetical protein
VRTRSSCDGDSSGEELDTAGGAATVGNAGAGGEDDVGTDGADPEDSGSGTLRGVLGSTTVVGRPRSKAPAAATTTATTPTLARSGTIARTPRPPTTRETEFHMRTRTLGRSRRLHSAHP